MTNYTQWKSLVDLHEYSALPDPDVYLMDDWGDNKLQDREDSGTTTHNGVEGIYRPEWTEAAGSVEATDEKIRLGQGSCTFAEINLNLDETIIWEWRGCSLNDNQVNAAFGLFAETNTVADLSGFTSAPLEDGYHVLINDDFDVRFVVQDDDSDDETIADVTVDDLSDFDLKVERNPDGEFEFILDGSSIGTATDDRFTDPKYIALALRDEEDSEEMSIDEMKVS